MSNLPDPAVLRALADDADVGQEALRSRLREVASRLDPFPTFPGAVFAYGLEVELPGDESELGCVILGDDGALYELEIGLDLTSERGERREELHPLDLPADRWERYARAALRSAAAYVERGCGG